MDKPILLFDGVCNLCQGSVQFVIQHDPEAKVRFASQQSAIGRQWMERYGHDPDRIDSLILIEDGRSYTLSSAALRIARHLSAPWRWLYALIIVPPLLRDPVYRLIAANRYRWFGQKDSCWMPTPDLRARFLDG